MPKYGTGATRYFITTGNTLRYLRTKNIQTILSNCSTITFWYIVGNQNNGGNSPETNKNFELEFLNADGVIASTVTIWTAGTLYPPELGNTSHFTLFVHTLPSIQKLLLM
jgi:hypothetical protein